MGLIGGVGLGIGYITPVSTLIKWFPDRRGMVTGMTIMGIGGGAIIGSPLADMLIKHFHAANPGSVGVWKTLTVMGLGYLLFMLGGAFGYRVPPAGWAPEGWATPTAKNAMIASGHVHLRDAHKTFQFWMLWLVLALNVSAGIGVLALASPMLQEIFGGALIGQPGVALGSFDAGQKAGVAAVAAGFVGLLSLFNIAGRFFWASMSDKLGRKLTYAIFFVLGRGSMRRRHGPPISAAGRCSSPSSA
jgi:MFS family permease